MRAPEIGVECKAQNADGAGGPARLCNAADRPMSGCTRREGLVQRGFQHPCRARPQQGAPALYHGRFFNNAANMAVGNFIASVYPLARHAHLGLVGVSVGLFMVRGLGILLGGAWPMRPFFKRASMVIDTALLAAGATLWALLQLNPLHNTWLGVKLILLVVYIVLGTFALKRGANVRKKAMFFLAALACVAFMASIAIRHHPLGWWAG
jgi:uncharacterized membrane protein SirB2